MTFTHLLDGFDMTPATLEREWVITIDTPTGGVEPVLIALGRELPLVQGPYDNCMFVREKGYQRFRALEGSHAGAEGTIQKTEAQQIVCSLPCDPDMLRKAFDVIFSVHVNEESTIRVEMNLRQLHVFFNPQPHSTVVTTNCTPICLVIESYH